MATARREDPRRVPLSVLNQRKEICGRCEFLAKKCGGELVCRLWKCRWRAQIRHVNGACALGNPEIATHMHLTPKWRKHVG
jgi:hypothetical protein